MKNTIELLAVLALAPLFAPIATAAVSARPNVLLIAVDDLNDWIGCMGGPVKSPNMDRLAAQGVRFDNAYCVSPACNPSRTALFTGLRPETTGQVENKGHFRDLPGCEDLVTLPQFLRANGYRAVAAGKLFHQPRGAGKVANPLSDPESWDDQHVGGVGTGGENRYKSNGVALWHKGTVSGYWGTGCFWGPIEEQTKQTADWKTADFCAKFLDQPQDKPFMLACGIFRPHSPQLAPRKFFETYPLAGVKLPEVRSNDFDDIPAFARTNFSTHMVRQMIQLGEWTNAVQAYLASASFADACIGHVLDALDRSPHASNTVVILWSDHGFQIGSKERFEKFTFWRQSTRTVFIIKAPGVSRPGVVCREAVSALDLYPTVAELCGLTPPKVVEGESLVPWLRKPAKPKSSPAVITYLPNNHSVVQGAWNYIHYANGSEELYNHDTDPDEFDSLIGKPGSAEIVAKLKPALPKWTAKSVSKYEGGAWVTKPAK